MPPIDGQFPFPSVKMALPFTGERMTTEMQGQIEYEHLHRYCMARDLCGKLDVVDVASGEGYGSAILARVARSVVGVEIDPNAVEHAKANYAASNLRFLVGDALALPLQDESADVVVSFETLEHVADHDSFLSEVRRVLRPGGLFVLSTPDRLVYSSPFREPNPYHVHELTAEELEDLLGRYFSQFEFLRQRPVLGSVIASSTKAGWRSYDRRDPGWIEASNGIARADYLVAIASDRELPNVCSSMYFDWRRVHNIVADALGLSVANVELASLRAEIEGERQRGRSMLVAEGECRDRLLAEERRLSDVVRGDLDAQLRENCMLQQSLREAEHENGMLQQSLREAEEARCAAERQNEVLGLQLRAVSDACGLAEAAASASFRCAAEADAAREQIEASAMWRLTRPARVLGARVPRLSRNVRRLMQVVWWTLTLQLRQRYRLWRRHRMNLSINSKESASFEGRAQSVVLSEQPVELSPSESPGVAESGQQGGAFPSVGSDMLVAFQVMHGRSAIFFPPVSEPEVSIILPLYRGLEDVLNCLRSLSVCRLTEPSFEVIVIDDCPDDSIHWALPNSGGLIKLVNDENLGFLRSCNRAATYARGRVMCFLNSDTIVQPGWLRNLVEVLDSSPRVGLVGGMLLNRDGTIQDAGWRILWNGWGHSLGRGADLQDGRYTYRRSVDCVTGACFVIRSEVWRDLEGFDQVYAPAFYEEFDLAFRARSKGLDVVYEPRSRVVHLGSNSYGPERRDRLSSINQGTFAKRFAEELRLQPTDISDEFVLRSLRPERPVILVADYGIPQPDRHAGDVTIFFYLSVLVDAGWRVVFAPHNAQAEGPHAEALESIGIELIRAPQTIDGWLARHGRHVMRVWLSRPEIAETLIKPIRTYTKAMIAYYTHDLHHLRLRREAEIVGDPALAEKAERMFEREIAVLRSADHIMTPSREEGDVIRRLVPGKPVTVLPPYGYEESAIRKRDAASFVGQRDVVFVGGFPHLPNVDAALFIAREVMPLVWREEPDARLILVGYAPPQEVLDLAGSRVIVTGQVPDILPYLDRGRVMLAALRYGAGVKGKVVEALRVGLPVVTTAVGAEGIGLCAGKDAIIAESALDLAAAVIELLRDADYCEKLSKAGTAVVMARFSCAAAREAVERVFYVPRCRVCGSVRLGVSEPTFGQREGFACLDCFALGRAEVLADVIVRRMARQGEATLAELFRRRHDIRVHEFGFVGGIARTLRGLQNYSESEFFPNVPPGEVGPGGIRCEDLTCLTFADASFDIVLSQDVMEHVPDPLRAFAETARVLKPGGSHFFTIPQEPEMERSIQRAWLHDGVIEHILEPVYHGDPVRSEGALVFTDFGNDLAAMLDRVGLVLIEHEGVVSGMPGGQTIRVFEAMKPVKPALSVSGIGEDQ
ncbi:methyltransferase domain-containing protein [Rhodovarius lipocyclicus]|uniref:methyltransferase domain-containing protein n=1 Tax=Rhodovarius lipocyclicus TaxID=268410 RepID=UPI0013567DB7|nr:methyltransferase domain-containing protein [Rhodovarius lipocyclicus]